MRPCHGVQLSLFEVGIFSKGPAKLPKTKSVRVRPAPSLPLAFGRTVRLPDEARDEARASSVSARRSAADVETFFDGLSSLLGGLRRDDAVEIHREGSLLRVEAGVSGLRVVSDDSELKQRLVPSIRELAWGYGLTVRVD